MGNLKPDVDVIKDILQLVLAARPDSPFISSLSIQYEQRGSLSKKQLEGLLAKANKIQGLAQGKLATLEAIILKMPTRTKSELPAITPLYNKDLRTGELIASILDRSPAHKRVLFLKVKFDNNELLSQAEISELEKFDKLLK